MEAKEDSSQRRRVAYACRVYSCPDASPNFLGRQALRRDGVLVSSLLSIHCKGSPQNRGDTTIPGSRREPYLPKGDNKWVGVLPTRTVIGTPALFLVRIFHDKSARRGETAALACARVVLQG